MQTLSELLELLKKLHFFLTLTFSGMHDNRWLLESIYSKGIPGIVVIEEVKTTTSKFEDI